MLTPPSTFTAALEGRCSDCPCFTDEETEAQKSQVSCLKLQSQLWQGPEPMLPAGPPGCLQHSTQCGQLIPTPGGLRT